MGSANTHQESNGMGDAHLIEQDTSTPTGRINKFLLGGLHAMQIVLAVCVGLIVLAGAICLACLLWREGTPTTLAKFTSSFQDVLSALLLLVVGVELAVLLILHRPESVVEIMFFVITRKVLIKTDSVYELVAAVLAIAGLFAIQKFLMSDGGQALRRERGRAGGDG
jgi:hypothetical protein